MCRVFPNGGKKFQPDLASYLSSKKVKTIFKKQKVCVLDWYRNSRDLKPTENL